MLKSKSVSYSIDKIEMPTYPFSDPDPVASARLNLYPYWRFDGQTVKSSLRKWTAVKLSNGIVEVMIMPEIGGKVWGAKDIESGRNFIYANDAVKFRDIAQRGPWCSGGIEFNFGVVGHAQWTSLPVDWSVEEKDNGKSVIYRCGGFEWSCRTFWMVEVELNEGDDFFTTKTTWRNLSGLPVPRYHWSNSAVTARGNPVFVYPGCHQIFHDGKAYPWPIDENGVDRSVYANSTDLPASSWHIIDGDNGFLGIWYPEWKFGMWHRNRKDAIFGRKIFMWSQARSGAIWEDNLTDNAGQYIELQAGRGMQQQTPGSEKTPFKMDTLYPGEIEYFEQQWGFSRDEKLFKDANGFPSEEIRRPVEIPPGCDFESVYMLCRQGEQTMRFLGDCSVAERFLNKALEKDPCFVPAISELAALELKRGNYAEAESFAQRALSIDAYDGAANFICGVVAAAKWAGRSIPRARERFGVAALDARFRNAATNALAELDGVVDEGFPVIPDPMFIYKNWKQNVESPLKDLFKCERPEETIIELALMFERAGRNDDAAVLYREAGAYPLAQLHLWGLTGEANSLKLAENGKIDFVFPFRHETIVLLKKAVRESNCWKFKYYLAVAMANFGNPEIASELLDQCGDEPDSAVFYLYRASRRKGTAACADLKRAGNIDDSWRVGRALTKTLIDDGKPDDAVDVSAGYLEKFPGVQPLEMAYVDALYAAKRYLDCVNRLRSMRILQDEFGRSTLNVWVTSNVALAEDAFEHGNEAEVRLYVDAALEFPENIGLGKPENMAAQLEKWIPERLRKYWSGNL